MKLISRLPADADADAADAADAAVRDRQGATAATATSCATPSSSALASLRQALQLQPAPANAAAVHALLRQLVLAGHADLPAPAAGQTLLRWQLLAEVAAHDLPLVKLFEGHSDALAVLQELGNHYQPPAGSTWGMWAAEAPGSRLTFSPMEAADSDLAMVRLQGKKAWCSGAQGLSHGLLTVWPAAPTAGIGSVEPLPYLAAVDMQQSGVRTASDGWQAVGMADSASVEVVFESATATLIGPAGGYLHRPGFWQGGAGIAACWHGGAVMLARALHQAVAAASPAAVASNPFRLAALGKVDVALQASAALLHEAAAWIDAHPAQDASAWAWRCRLGAEAAARTVLDEVGRALGATPFCRDARFARMAADLPVFVRQSHAERDFAALGLQLAQSRAVAGVLPVWSL